MGALSVDCLVCGRKGQQYGRLLVLFVLPVSNMLGTACAICKVGCLHGRAQIGTLVLWYVAWLFCGKYTCIVTKNKKPELIRFLF